MPLNSKNKVFLLLLLIILVFSFGNTAYSQSIDELKTKISDHSDKIKQLDQEIKAYQKQIEAVGNEAKSLQSAIKVLDVNQKKIGTEIKKTETTIQQTNLTINSLNLEIKDIEEKLFSNEQAIGKTLNDMRQSDDQSLIENILTDKSIADVLDEYEVINQFQVKVEEQSDRFEIYKNSLSEKKSTKEGEKKKLLNLKGELVDQNKILDNNKKEKSTLLTTTKNKEAEYKKILAQRQIEKERAEKELFDFESKLKIAIDPNSYPSGKKGVLSYPLDNVVITQYFGSTADSKRLYTSGTHNGVDFRATRGTPVKAVLNGTITATGNTDEQVGCYSYGKWILISHPNGLSSLYGHLDLIKVTAGQNVNEGEIIGYSGQTGYATGPHLHLTIYASQGVQVQKFSSSKNCKNVSIPVASQSAYLDPMLYF